ncbi:hypothetical protein HII36_42270, partial [Nonomuraea sp. NN258]|uniref:hypothetical protein n=1 Tax=Nonomuraea antri TaxID=2730852 RepID=UPI001C2C2A3B
PQPGPPQPGPPQPGPSQPGPPPGPAQPGPGWGRGPSSGAPAEFGASGGFDEPEEPWNPRIRRAVTRAPADGRHAPRGDRRGVPHGLNVPPRRGTRGLEPADAALPPWDSLPPSARLYGSPADPGLRRRASRRGGRFVVPLLAALTAAAVLATLVMVVTRLTAPAREPAAQTLNDALSGVTLALPAGWRAAPLPPVTGFTSAIRDDSGAMIMAGPAPESAADARKTAAEAAERFSRLLLRGDRVTVVGDRRTPRGHTRALRAEYQGVANRPAYLRVMLLTREGGDVLLVGLLQPEDNTRKQALDAVMSSIR